MSTSGTYSFLMSRDDLIGAALRVIGAYGAGEAIPSGDITNCAQALNILAKEYALEGLPLWCVQTTAIPMVVGQSVYNLSVATGQTLPLAILDCYIRDSNGNDTIIKVVSRYDYDPLGQKTAQGVPNQLYYDPQLATGNLILYNVPADTTHTLYVVSQRQIQDFNLSTDNPDFPQEAFRLLKWALADEIALEYQTPVDVRKEVLAKAMMYKEKFSAAGQEMASVRFTPSEQTH